MLTNMLIYLVALFFITCWIWIVGVLNASLQGGWPRTAKELRPYNLIVSIILGGVLSLVGPLGILIAWSITDQFKFGWRLK